MTATLTKPDTRSFPGKKPPALLQVEDLAVSFDIGNGRRVQAVDGLHLTVHPRQTLAVVGESGCGKSVTALTTLQLIPRPPGRVDRGAIRFLGRDLLRLGAQDMLHVRGREIAMIFQEPMTSLNPVQSIGEQIIEAIRLHQEFPRREARAIATVALNDVGIPDPSRALKMYPHEFSGGMRQRAMIAMALACQPKLLLADEPTTALDVTIQQQTLRLLEQLQHSRGMGVMLISHDLGVVAETADVVCVMYAGRVVEYANVFDLFGRAYHPYTRGLLGSIPKLHESRRRLRTVSEFVDDPREFRTLPGAAMGIVPWWPAMPPPADLVAPNAADRAAYHLYEIEPEHWVGCWRTKYLADHPTRLPDIEFRRKEK